MVSGFSRQLAPHRYGYARLQAAGRPDSIQCFSVLCSEDPHGGVGDGLSPPGLSLHEDGAALFRGGLPRLVGKCGSPTRC